MQISIQAGTSIPQLSSKQHRQSRLANDGDVSASERHLFGASVTAWLHTAAHVANGHLGILLMSVGQPMVMRRKQPSAMSCISCVDSVMLTLPARTAVVL